MPIHPRPASLLPASKRRRLNPSSSEPTLLTLPDDTLRHIFTFLHPPAPFLNRQSLVCPTPVVALAGTCTHLYKLSREMYCQLDKLDFLYPGTLETRTCLHGLSNEEAQGVQRMAQNGLRVLRLPADVDIKMLSDMFDTFGQPSCLIRELAFEDNGRVDNELARLLSLMPHLENIEVLRPGKVLLREMAHGMKHLRSFMIRGVDAELLQDVVNIFRVRAWRGGRGRSIMPLRHVSVGMCLRSPEHGSIFVETVEEQAKLDAFLNYLERNASSDLRGLKTYALVTDHKHQLLEKFLRRLKSKLANGSSVFASQTEVHVEQGGRRLVVSALTALESGGAMRDVSIQAVMAAARHGNDQFVCELRQAGTLYVPTPGFVTRYENGGEGLRKKCMKILEEGGGNLRRLQMEVGLNNYGHSLAYPSKIFKCTVDLLNSARNITAIQISSDVVEWADTSYNDFIAMLKACAKVEIMHLTPAEVLTSGWWRWTNTNDRKARFVRRLPLFLELVSKYCPRLQYLYLEETNVLLSHYCGRNVSGSLRIAKEALEKVKRFDVSTVKAQIDRWISKLETS